MGSACNSSWKGFLAARVESQLKPQREQGAILGPHRPLQAAQKAALDVLH